MSVAIELFVIGITLSMSSCLFFCTPVILSYVAGTRRGWQEGLKAILIFSFTRLIVYFLLGLLAGWLGNLLTEKIFQFGYVFFLGGGFLISLMGLFIIFRQQPTDPLCRVFKKEVGDNSVKGPIILGLTMGTLPCLPLVGVLTYIALKTQNLWQGAFYGFAFGAGKFISPLIPLGVLAGMLPAGLNSNCKIYRFFRKLCGIILFFIGVNLVVSSIG